MVLKKLYNSPTIMSWVSNFVRFGSFIFVIPLVLTSYTELEQSLWFLTNTIIGFAMLAESGFGSILIRAVAYFKAGSASLPTTKKEFEISEEIKNPEPNQEMLGDLLTTTNRVYLFLAGLLILLLSTGGIAFVWNIMKLSGHRYDFWLAYFLLIPYSVISIMTVKWGSFSKGLDFVAFGARIKTVTSSFRIIIFVILLILKAKPAALIMVMLLEALIINWYFRNNVLNWMKENQIAVKNKFKFKKEIFWSIWPATWRLAGLFWGTYMVSSGNSIIIAQISDAKLMAGFLFATKIIDFLRNVSETPFFANVPTLYTFAAQKKIQELKVKSAQYVFLGVMIFITGSALLILLGNWSLELIHSNTRLLDTGLLILMCLIILLDLHSSFHASIYISTNHIPFLLPALISGALIIGLGFVILPIYGLLGILLVRFLVELSFNNWYTVFLSLKLLKWPFLQYIVEMPKIGIAYLRNKTKYFNPVKFYK